VPKYG